MASMTSARTSMTGKEMLISFTVIGNAGVAALNQILEGRKSAAGRQLWLCPLSRVLQTRITRSEHFGF
jgi:hypothetical protein